MKPFIPASCNWCYWEGSRAGSATETSGGTIVGRGGGSLGDCALIKTGKSGATTGYCCFLSNLAQVVSDYTVFDCLERIRGCNRYSHLHKSCSYDHLNQEIESA